MSVHDSCGKIAQCGRLASFISSGAPKVDEDSRGLLAVVSSPEWKSIQKWKNIRIGYGNIFDPNTIGLNLHIRIIIENTIGICVLHDILVI